MGEFPKTLAVELERELSLTRAVETGTYTGGGALALAEIFGSVVTIEVSPAMYSGALERLRDAPSIEPVLGDSREVLPRLVDGSEPTFFWLDGHWSGGETGGVEAECPVLEELAAIAAGHPDDCITIDDARLFAAPPPPPHDPAHWPTLVELFDAVRAARPTAHVTVVGDVVVAVPARAKDLVDAWGRQELQAPDGPAPAAGPGVATRLRALLDRR